MVRIEYPEVKLPTKKELIEMERKASRLVKRITKFTEEAHRKAAKSKLHFP